jgi:catechol 2,3-dioxygenase-like lactoylglutathione lyase family enzyme
VHLGAISEETTLKGKASRGLTARSRFRCPIAPDQIGLRKRQLGDRVDVMRPQSLINCRDVQASSRWYQKLLGCIGGHGGAEYERLWDPRWHTSKWGSDGLILQLHAWDVDHHHGPMGDPAASVGNGVLLWFEVDDFDVAVARARELEAPIVLDVHHNPNADHREIWLRDPDGYTVVLASPDGVA